MKRILLATTLLSIAMSEDILTENYPRPAMWIRDEQFWRGRTKRLSRNDISSEMEDLSNYDDDGQLTRISDTRLVSETMKLPSAAVVRPDLVRLSQSASASKSKLDVIKPTVWIAISAHGGTRLGSSREGCTTRDSHRARKYNQDWQIQQPFYVEEPQWIEIDPSYVDDSRLEDGDPYILSRGKKIASIADHERLGRTIEDYESLLDYPINREQPSTKSRARRSVVEVDENFWMTDGRDDGEGEASRRDSLRDVAGGISKVAPVKRENRDDVRTERTTKRPARRPAHVHDVAVEKREGDGPNDPATMSTRGREFKKWNRVAFSSGVRIANSIVQERRTRNADARGNIETGNGEIARFAEGFNSRKGHLAVDATEGGEGLALHEKGGLVEARKKRGSRETDRENADPRRNAGKKKTAAFERTKGDAYKLYDFDTYDDPFVLSRGKKPFGSGAEDSKRKDADRGKFRERRWRYSSAVKRRRKGSESEGETWNDEESETGIDKDGAKATDARSTSGESDSREFGTKNSWDSSGRRRKRSVNYETRPKLQDEWLKNIQEQVQDSSYANPMDEGEYASERDKICASQRVRLADPYVIIRGKKALRELTDKFYAAMEPRNEIDGADFSTERAPRRLLLVARFRYNDRNYGIANASAKGRSGMRDRRGSLDKILNLETFKYDPFYLVRGKRTSPDSFRSNGQSQKNRWSAWSDAARNDRS